MNLWEDQQSSPDLNNSLLAQFSPFKALMANTVFRQEDLFESYLSQRYQLLVSMMLNLFSSLIEYGVPVFTRKCTKYVEVASQLAP